MTYEVHTRHGWGWEVIGPGHQSNPFESAIDAQELADDLNTGFDLETAYARNERRTYFQSGRFYSKQA